MVAELIAAYPFQILKARCFGCKIVQDPKKERFTLYLIDDPSASGVPQYYCDVCTRRKGLIW